jgi:GT2 family glycosyltransferase
MSGIFRKRSLRMTYTLQRLYLETTVHTVIVTYNNRDLLGRCIATVTESLERSPYAGKITVVDNGSTDGTVDLIKDRYPDVHYIRNRDNIGLTKALNEGIQSGLDCAYTLLLNDDVKLFPDTISRMLRTLHKYPEARGIPACLIYPDGSPQRVKLSIIGVQKRIRQGVKYINFAGTTACMYYTDIFKELGLFDEFYFFYNEDLDFSLRAKRAGIRFVFDPEIKVIHYRKKGRKKAARVIRPYFYATDYYFYRKNFGVLFSAVYLAMALTHIAANRRKFTKSGDEEKLRILNEGASKLKYTIRNFKGLVRDTVHS